MNWAPPLLLRHRLPGNLRSRQTPRRISTARRCLLGAGQRSYAGPARRCRRPGSPAIGARRWWWMCASGSRNSDGPMVASPQPADPLPELEARTAEIPAKDQPVVVLLPLPAVARSGDPAPAKADVPQVGQSFGGGLVLGRPMGLPLTSPTLLPHSLDHNCLDTRAMNTPNNPHASWRRKLKSDPISVPSTWREPVNSAAADRIPGKPQHSPLRLGRTSSPRDHWCWFGQKRQTAAREGTVRAVGGGTA